MRIWSREQGLVEPPEELAYAQPGRHDFKDEFRTRVVLWAEQAFRRIQHGTNFGDVINPEDESWEALYEGLSGAYGRSPLIDPPSRVIGWAAPDPEGQLRSHVATCADNEVIDFISGVFQVSASRAAVGDDEAQEIGSLVNQIFEEEGVGYRWVTGQIIRFDDAPTHELAVRPAKELLTGGAFGQADQEFADALDAYRAGRWRDAITNANAAFESVLKVRTGESGAQAGRLIQLARERGLIPSYVAASAEELAKIMQAVPAARGQDGAHGLGDRASQADQHLAQFVLSSAASYILLIGRRP